MSPYLPNVEKHGKYVENIQENIQTSSLENDQNMNKL